MGRLNDLVAMAKKYIDEHPDTVAGGLDKVGDLVDKGTKGKFSSQIRQGRDLAKDKLVHGAASSPAGSRHNATEAAHLDPKVAPQGDETFEATTVGKDEDADGRTPGQIS